MRRGFAGGGTMMDQVDAPVGPPADPAMKVAREVGAENGDPVHVGAIRSPVAGRTDKHEIRVPAGSYVLTADHVSGLGEGNTEAGLHILEKMFPHSTPVRADGGGVDGSGEMVPVVVAGGEFIVSPRDLIARWGNVDHGHKFLDHWQTQTRKNLIKTLKGLPGPAQD